jgi:GGDEF domain-containing protein
MLLAFALTALGVLCLSSSTRVGEIAVALAALAILVVMARLVMTWQQNVSLLNTSRHEAITDALTSLGNRRALAAELRRALSDATPDRPAALVLL